mgnify:CR=1 FL=1
MRVILNTWLGDGFENNNCCDLCGRLATTVELETLTDSLKVCKSCLTNAEREIDKAFLTGGKN